MQDLLKESEFKRRELNPWRLFYAFYIIAAIQAGLILVVSASDIGKGDGRGSVIFAMPTATAIAMFFYRKKNTELPLPTLALAFLILLAIFYVPFIVIALFKEKPIRVAVSYIGSLVLNYTVVMLIVAIMLRIAKGRKH